MHAYIGMEKFLGTGCFLVASTGPNISSLTSDCHQNTIQYKLCHNIVQGQCPHMWDFNQDADKCCALIKLGTWQPAHKGSSSTLPTSFRTFPVFVSIMVSPNLRLRCPLSAFSILGVTQGLRSLRSLRSLVKVGGPKDCLDNRSARIDSAFPCHCQLTADGLGHCIAI